MCGGRGHYCHRIANGIRTEVRVGNPYRFTADAIGGFME